jgi:hypothetical protein
MTENAERDVCNCVTAAAEEFAGARVSPKNSGHEKQFLESSHKSCLLIFHNFQKYHKTGCSGKFLPNL